MARVRLFALALLVSLSAGAQDDPKDLKPPFTFALYGDSRDGHDVHRRICTALHKSDARFVIQSGDLVAKGDEDKQWETFREITRELRAKLPYYAAKGNHDRGKKGLFEKEMGLTQPYYDRILGTIHFFFLDSNSLKADQLTWLEQTAAKSTAMHKIAVFHHPAYSLVVYRQKEAESVRVKLEDLLLKHKFCAALCGHDHHFYTTVRKGLRWVITGGGGAPLYPQDEKFAQAGDLFRRFHHFILCRVEERKITARVFDPDGQEAADLAFTLCEHK